MADTTVKRKVLKAVEKMPPDVTFEDVMECLYFPYKVYQGLKQAEAGDTMSHKEPKSRHWLWLPPSQNF